jgi:hypothetical protein
MPAAGISPQARTMILPPGPPLDQQFIPGVKNKDGKCPVQPWIPMGVNLFSSSNHAILFIHKNYIFFQNLYLHLLLWADEDTPFFLFWGRFNSLAELFSIAFD